MPTIKILFNIKLNKFTLNTAFEIPNKKITLIKGKPGAGKTILLKCISGLIKPNGYFKLDNKYIQNSEFNIFIPANKRKFGFVFQTPYLFPHMSCIDNLKFGYNLLKKEERKIKIEDIINSLSLEKLLTKKAIHLSGGEKQKIVIGQAILTSPKLLLMDEPFSSLDHNNRKKISQTLKEINENFSLSIIYTSHVIDEIEKITNFILNIENGEIKYF